MRWRGAWLACALAWLAAPPAPAGACSSSISKRPSRPQHPSPRAPAPPRPAAPASAPAPQPPPPPRTNVTFPTYRCESPYAELYCLNDAKCFVVVIEQSPIYNCECRDGFVGQRCEYKDLENSYVLMSRRLMMETASIAGGATVAVFLALLVCFGAWVRLRRRRKEPPEEERGAVELVAIADGARTVSLPCRPPSDRTRPPPAPSHNPR